MATFKQVKPLPRSFVRKLKSSPLLRGPEGKELSQKINKVSQDIQEDEPIQRLLKFLEEDNEKRHQELQCYLNELRSEAELADEVEFTTSTLDITWNVWESLKKLFRSKGLCLEVPDACPGQRNNFMFTWSKADHYLECEVFSSGEVEFFYRNRNNGEVWGEDTTLEQGFSTTIFDKVALFAW